MPLQNRVTPFGELVAEDARGMLMGNRGGRFHEPGSRVLARRRWVSQRWICCVLAFKSRARKVWGNGYTELFFLDEVTALAAGHRPCCECRRGAARSFQTALARALPGPAPSFRQLDSRLHAERLDGREKRLHRLAPADLPDGAMIALAGKAFALRGGRMLPWSLAGYGPPRPAPSAEVDVLTPPTAVTALRGGYVPLWHPTAPAPYNS